jgi:hypothetical protein
MSMRLPCRVVARAAPLAAALYLEKPAEFSRLVIGFIELNSH